MIQDKHSGMNITDKEFTFWLDYSIKASLSKPRRWSNGKIRKSVGFRGVKGFLAEGRSPVVAGDRCGQECACSPDRAFGWEGFGEEVWGREYSGGIRESSGSGRGVAEADRVGGGMCLRVIWGVSEAVGEFLSPVRIHRGSGIWGSSQSESADDGRFLAEDRCSGCPEPGRSSPAGEGYTVCDFFWGTGRSPEVSAIGSDADAGVKPVEGSDSQSVIVNRISGVRGFLLGCHPPGLTGDSANLSFCSGHCCPTRRGVCSFSNRGWSNLGEGPAVSENLSGSTRIDWDQSGGRISLGIPVDSRAASGNCEGAEGVTDQDCPDIRFIPGIPVGTNGTWGRRTPGSYFCGGDRRSSEVSALAANNEAGGIESSGSGIWAVLGNTSNLSAGQGDVTMGRLSSSGNFFGQRPLVSSALSESPKQPGRPERGKKASLGEVVGQDSQDCLCDSPGPDKVYPGAGYSRVGSLINGESSPFKITLRLAPRRGTMGPLARYILNWIRVVWQASGLNTHRNAGCNNHDELDIPGGESSPNEVKPTPIQANGEVLPNRTIDKSILVVPYLF